MSEMNLLKIKSRGIEYSVLLAIHYYQNGNLAIALEEEHGEPYGVLTINLGDKLPSDYAYLDTNMHPNAEEIVKEYGLAENTGKYEQSGFCTYPLYKFNISRLRELSVDFDEMMKEMEESV